MTEPLKVQDVTQSKIQLGIKYGEVGRVVMCLEAGQSESQGPMGMEELLSALVRPSVRLNPTDASFRGFRRSCAGVSGEAGHPMTTFWEI